ncbi:MAG TPA: transcriptional repressor [Ktedonobacterales bacterium]|jgi:Fur family peroxide stress response transcriptional regulator|nr:transcriptional repressor [Ktedonobacterales bacterium]
MRTVDELIERVRKQGGKATSQRILIWATLHGDRTHPTADDLYRRLKPALPSLSMTTLYNVLNELVEWGEIRRFDTGDGHIHFDPDTSGHAELVCMRCHKVIDAPDGSTPAHETPDDIAGFTIVSHSEQYFGYCPECRELMREASHEAREQRMEAFERVKAHASGLSERAR